MRTLSRDDSKARFWTVDRGIPVHYLLKHLGAGDEPLSRQDQALQQRLSFTLVRLRTAT